MCVDARVVLELRPAGVEISETVRVTGTCTELRQEESEHVAMVKQWMAKYPKPTGDWAHDPDPPRYNE